MYRLQVFFYSTRKKRTRRERPKSAPYLRLKNIQGTTIGNISIFFFKKSIWLKKSRTMLKNPKRSLGSLNVFHKPKTSKKARGYPLIKFENFRKKSCIVPKKNQHGDPLVSLVLLEALKNYGLVRESNPRYPGSENWSKLNKL